MRRPPFLTVFPLVPALLMFISASCADLFADDSKPAFQITKNHVDRVVGRGEPDIEYVGVQNTGKAVINEINYEGEFIDPKSGSTLLIPPTPTELPKGGIRPGDQVSVKVAMSRPHCAGSFSGALLFSSPGADSKSVGVVVRSRGPIPMLPFGNSAFYELPIILFVIAVLVGFGVSMLLDRWMGTDLPRLRAVQSLRSAQATILGLSQRVRNWPTEHPSLASFPSAITRLSISIPDLNRVIGDASQGIPADLTTAVQTYSLISTKLLLLSSALDQVEVEYTQKGNDSANLAYLNSVIKRLDALDFTDTSPLALFRTNVINAMSPSSSAGTTPSGAPVAASQSVVQTDQIEAAQRKIKRHIWLIIVGQQAVVWVVVVLVGLTTYFLNNPTYGSLADYIGTLLWSLGLTQTGKQIMARAR